MAKQETVRQRFARRLAERLAQLGWTQRMLGERLGLTEGAVSKWTNERSEPDDLAQLVQICTTLHVTVDWLLDMPDAPQPPPPAGDPRAMRRTLAKLRGAVVDAFDDAIAAEKKNGR